MSKREPLYVFAKNTNNEIIHINDAVKNNKYFCPYCGDEMILKRSVLLKKIPHFAHKKLNTNCTPESIIHFAYKKKLFEIIKEKIIKSIPLNIEWYCRYCKETHKGNLIKKITDAKLEYHYKEVKPDIVLFKNNIPYIAVEIVFSHAPEIKTINFYKKMGIILFVIKINDEKDVLNLNINSTLKGDLDFCLYKHCPICNSFLYPRKIIVSEVECWKCGKKMKIAYSDYKRENIYGPEWFDKRELKIARDNGVLIEFRYSKTIHTKYMSNVCPYCKSIFGQFFIHNYIQIPNEKEIFVGLYCNKCKKYYD